MIKGKDIVIIGIQPWDIEIGSNCKNIAFEFAKENRVLYVNPPMDRITRIKQKTDKRIQKRIRIAKGQSPDIEKIGNNLWNVYPKNTVASIQWIGSHSLFKLLNKRNTKLLSSDMKSAITRLGFSDFILFNDSSMFLGLHLKEFLQPKAYVYYMRDYLVKVPYWQKHGERMEPSVVKKADVLTTNSDFFAEFGSQYNANSYMVGQGCDISHFSDEDDTIKVPVELKNISSPVIGYVGSLTTLRLDIELLQHIANQRTNWSVVLVGPEDEDFKKSNLHNLPNVYFLGKKDGSELPNYVKGFDIAINPQLSNNLTIGNYPRKIDEYLAMGKPIIATKTKAMEMFKEYVYLGASKEEYITLIEKALAENSPELENKRINFAKSHTWTNNVSAIYSAIIKATKHRIQWA
jgi:teichuronic acid biosynthesis glycosyltransferase TuaH